MCTSLAIMHACMHMGVYSDNYTKRENVCVCVHGVSVSTCKWCADVPAIMCGKVGKAI